jgi:hypothetical protein
LGCNATAPQKIVKLGGIRGIYRREIEKIYAII